jgi:hypothetical protein
MATVDEIRIIRTLIPDTEAVFGPTDNATMFTDTEIADFFTAGRDSVLRAAGLANYAIATSEALISKKIKTQDLQTDGPAVADSLIKKGDALLKQADTADSWDGFQIVYPVWGATPELTEPDVSTVWF